MILSLDRACGPLKRGYHFCVYEKTASARHELSIDIGVRKKTRSLIAQGNGTAKIDGTREVRTWDEVHIIVSMNDEREDTLRMAPLKHGRCSCRYSFHQNTLPR